VFGPTFSKGWVEQNGSPSGGVFGPTFSKGWVEQNLQKEI
jgi:hypothetical protein